MAGRIQGITVEIGGDTTKLQTVLKGVNTEIRNTQSQLRDVDKLLKLDPGNTELLAQKHRLLGDAFKETKEKLETLKTAAEQADQALKAGTITQDQYSRVYRTDIVSVDFSDVLGTTVSGTMDRPLVLLSVEKEADIKKFDKRRLRHTIAIRLP